MNNQEKENWKACSAVLGAMVGLMFVGLIWLSFVITAKDEQLKRQKTTEEALRAETEKLRQMLPVEQSTSLEDQKKAYEERLAAGKADYEKMRTQLLGDLVAAQGQLEELRQAFGHAEANQVLPALDGLQTVLKQQQALLAELQQEKEVTYQKIKVMAQLMDVQQAVINQLNTQCRGLENRLKTMEERRR